jgi:spore maturation protein CgeB
MTGFDHSGLGKVGSPAGTVKAVIAADLRNWTTGAGIAVGLRLQGWLVHEIDLKSFYPASDSATLKLAGKALGPAFRASYNRTVLEACRSLDADAFISIKGTGISSETIGALNAAGIQTAIYYPDYHFNYAGLDLDTIRDVGLIATTKSFQLDWLREFRSGRPSIYIPHGYSPLVEMAAGDPPAEDRYDYDVAYVGNPSGPKRDLLVQVAQACPNLRLVVAGNGWKRAARGTALEPFVLGHPLVGDMLADIHRRSRINIAIHMQAPVNGWIDFVSRRTFEIPAFRGFMLHVDNEEVRSFYDVRGEIDIFSTPDDLIEKIRFYLAEPDRRRQMIERAYDRAVPHYGHHLRAMELARAIEGIRAETVGRRPDRPGGQT